jgi:hypothetical protein
LCTVVDALALEAKSHLESIVGEGAKELTVPVPFLPPPAPASIVDAPGPAPEDRPKAPGSEEEVKQMAKEDKKRKELEDAQREAMRRENSLLRGRHAMGMENPTMDRLFVAAPDLGIEQTKIDSMLKVRRPRYFFLPKEFPKLTPTDATRPLSVNKRLPFHTQIPNYHPNTDHSPPLPRSTDPRRAVLHVRRVRAPQRTARVLLQVQPRVLLQRRLPEEALEVAAQARVPAQGQLRTRRLRVPR